MAETKPVAAAKGAPAASSSSSDKSSDSHGSGGGSSSKFNSIFHSIQKNIETLNYVTKEMEKINDKIMFRSSTMTPDEESSLISKVSHLHKDTSMKARDTSRTIKNLRVEGAKPSPSPEIETKGGNEKSEEEDKTEKSLDVEEKEEICKKVTRSFTDELLLYQSAIQDFKNELKERLTKRIQSIRPKASEDFIDMSLRSESSRYALFREIMATDEKDLSEEEAKALKDEIAEKYVVIAELSSGAAEINKIFLNLTSTSNPNASSSSESSEEELDGQTQQTQQRRSSRSSISARSQMIDDLLGNPNLKMDISTRSTRSHKSMDSSARSTRSSRTETSSAQSQRRSRLYGFMKRHKRASTTTAKKLRFDTADARSSRPRRRGRASRWMALFLLATVALAAMAGIVMLH